TIDVLVESLDLISNPTIATSYPVRGKLISNKPENKLDGYQVVLYAATTPATTTPEFAPVASARTETNGYFVTSSLLFENPSDVSRVTAAKASVSKDNFSTELPIRLVLSGNDGARA